MRVCHLAASIDHDHSIGIAPFGCWSPYPGDCKRVFTGQAVPCPRHAACFALGFCPCAYGYQAAPFGEAVTPEGRAQLVLTRVVDGSGLEFLPLLAGERERESPCHRPHHTFGDHEARITRIDILAEVGANDRLRLEQPCHFVRSAAHLVEIAHRKIIVPARAESIAERRLDLGDWTAPQFGQSLQFLRRWPSASIQLDEPDTSDARFPFDCGPRCAGLRIPGGKPTPSSQDGVVNGMHRTPIGPGFLQLLFAFPAHPAAVPIGCGVGQDVSETSREHRPISLTFRAFCASIVAHNVGMTVVLKLQDSHVAFRANEALVAALAERARKAGCSTSEYLRAIVREKVGL